MTNRTPSLTTETAPSAEPLSTQEAKNYLRVDHSADDTLIDDLIQTAREEVEDRTHRALITQTLKMTWDHQPEREIELWRPPLQSVNSVKYIDDDGNTQTYDSSNYIVDSDSTPGRVRLKSGSTWPSDLQEFAAIEIRYDAGYGDQPSDVPSALITAVKKKIADLYELRMGSLPEGFKSSDMPYRDLVAPFVVHYL